MSARSRLRINNKIELGDLRRDLRAAIWIQCQRLVAVALH